MPEQETIVMVALAEAFASLSATLNRSMNIASDDVAGLKVLLGVTALSVVHAAVRHPEWAAALVLDSPITLNLADQWPAQVPVSASPDAP